MHGSLSYIVLPRVFRRKRNARYYLSVNSLDRSFHAYSSDAIDFVVIPSKSHVHTHRNLYSTPSSHLFDHPKKSQITGPVRTRNSFMDAIIIWFEAMQLATATLVVVYDCFLFPWEIYYFAMSRLRGLYVSYKETLGFWELPRFLTRVSETSTGCISERIGVPKSKLSILRGLGRAAASLADICLIAC